MVRPLWKKNIWQFLKKWNTELPYDLAIPLLAIYGVWFLYDIFHNKKENENKNKISLARLVLQNKVQVPRLPAFRSPLHNLAPTYLSSLVSNILLPPHDTNTQSHTTWQPLTRTLPRLVGACPAQHLLLPVLDRPRPSPGTWVRVSLAWPSSRPSGKLPHSSLGC